MAVPLVSLAARLAQKLPKKLVRAVAKHARNRRSKRDEDPGKRSRKRMMWLPAVLLILFASPLVLMFVAATAVTNIIATEEAETQNVALSLAALCGGAGLHAAAEARSGGQPQTGVLTPVQIARYAAAAGFTGEDLVIAVAVALAESGGQVDIDNEGLNDDGSIDYGLWQINSVHQANGFDPSRAFDPAYNAAWARTVFMNAGASWTPWTAYKNGSYGQHMAEAREATGIPEPTESPTAPASGQPVSPIACAQPGGTMVAGGFPAAIDPYQPYHPQRTCSPAPKPGVRQFANLLLTTYPVSSSSGIARSCGIGGTSEHKEGRAFDWAVSATDPTQRAAAESAINWLLATDEHGNRHAMFRRFGLMYIIWNRQIFTSSQPGAGWRPYPCSPGASFDDCHVRHVHFSFGWPGALQQTSWWTAPRSAPENGQTEEPRL